MIDLNEYLGGIANSIAEARLISDLKSVEIAEKFAKHDLLKHFSIPRFKAQNIELTIPVAIGALENNYAKDYEPINDVEFSSQTYTVLKDVTRKKSFERSVSTKLKSLINNEIDLLEREIKSGASKKEALNKYSEKLTSDFLEIYFGQIKEEQIIKSLNEGLSFLFKRVDKELLTSLTIELLEENSGNKILDIRILNELKEEISEIIDAIFLNRPQSADTETEELVYYPSRLIANYSEKVVDRYLVLTRVVIKNGDLLSTKLSEGIRSRNKSTFNYVIYNLLIDISEAIFFNRNLSEEVKKVVSSRREVLEEKLEGGAKVKLSLFEYSKEVINQFLQISKKEVNRGSFVKKLNSELIGLVKEREIENQKPKVIVESHKLQDIKPENVIQIKMTLNEEGLEWHTSENEKGEVSTQLLPE